jgi:membrane-associated phospholipid phosphatase
MVACRNITIAKSVNPFIVCLSLYLLHLSAIAHAQVEPEAGGWRTWVLKSGNELRLPPPPGEKETRKEIEELRVLEAQRDDATQQRVSFWNAGSPAYRWTTIAIPPGPANAVVNTRIMALVSVAIYDATVAAWDSKYFYNRARPSRVDPALTTMIANPESPSYPSEHAVTAGAAATVLGYLFPDQAKALQARAEESAQTWLDAGIQYPSDVRAGLELGRAVGLRVVDWARHDGSDHTGDVEIPPGPCRWTGINPASPFAGTWRTWVLSKPNQLRPEPPPDCRSEQGQAELAELRDFQRTFETNDTAFYWQGPRSLQFNYLDRKISEYRLDTNPPRAARVYVIASISGYDAMVACWDAKYTYWKIRPFMLGINTVFATPNHPSYPAAHGCVSGAIFGAAASLFPADADYFNGLANEAGTSRIYAGIHFRSDVDAGLELGREVAQLVIERAEN